MIIAEHEGAVLRHAREDDLPRVAEIAVRCYATIHDSYVDLLGEACYAAAYGSPERTWQERKAGRLQRLCREHPDWLWVLERSGEVIGFVSFVLKPEKQVAGIKANGVLPEQAGRGWGSFMYRQVLRHFRAQGVRFAYADTGLGDAHGAARRAYEAAGFDRPLPLVRYWQDLDERDPESEPN